ncbi:MAG: hypothetical protein C0407_12060 [Desulfobacca sp.]|nr:hypothetical protein [Desulfobacca sp.]
MPVIGWGVFCPVGEGDGFFTCAGGVLGVVVGVDFGEGFEEAFGGGDGCAPGGVVFLEDDVGSLTGVLSQACLGGGLTVVDFHPGLGGGFIPFGISTISPVAFLYFSALAGQGHKPVRRRVIKKPGIKNMALLINRPGR